MAWLTSDIKDSFEILILTLLARILIGNPASPLRKALIDSGLGTALGDGTGFDSDNRDTMFAVGLKDVEKSSAARIESIIFDVLKNLADQGIDKTLIEAAIHQIEFHRKEVTNTPYPYGIKLLLAFAAGWFHGGDPEKTLKFDADLERLRAELSQGPFFENRIKKYFLDNTHRVLFTLVPDQQLEQQENERVAAELDRIRADMSRSTLEQIIEDAKTLKQLQESREDTSCLPTLELAEIPPSVQSVKETDSYPQVPATCYKQPTAGIFYFAAAAGVGSLTKKLVPLVPFFCYALPRVGTSVRNYTEMAQLIDRYTGGIELSSHARTCFDKTGGCLPFISFGGKCLVRNQDKMFDIIEELLCKFDFSDLVRLKSLLLEFRAGLESMVVHNGHRLAISLASRSFSTASALGETWHGIHQLQTIKGITDDLADDKLKSIANDLSLIGNTIFTGNKLKIALIGEDQDIIGASLPIASLQKGLVQDANSGSDFIKATDGFRPPKTEHDHEIPGEGWSTSSAVSFVASTFETVRMKHADAPALAVISKLLRSMYLHREIREKGGAYGGFAIYNSEDGLFCFASYRDPHIVSTLKAYDGASIFIRSGNYTDEDIKEAILQVCAEIDKPDPPGPAARKAFYRKIVSLSDKARIRFKKKLLTLTRNQVKKVAEKYFAQNRIKKGVAVISGEEKLKEANKKLADNPLKLYRI